MKLEYLWLDEFKNLRDFKVAFETSYPEEEQKERKREPLSPEEDRFRVVLGQNGSGKSNLLEALVIIFRDLDLGEITEFAYELRYTMKGGRIKVEVKNRPKAETAHERFSFVADMPGGVSLTVSRSRVAEARRDLRPHNVFSYYSGPSNRLEKHFWPHQKKYSEALRKERDLPLRPFFYAMPIHSQFVLLAFFSSQDSKGREFLEKYFSIVGVESALFVMKEPHWKSKEGDPRFWNARWVVARFLDKLFFICTVWVVGIKHLLKLATAFSQSQPKWIWC